MIWQAAGIYVFPLIGSTLHEFLRQVKTLILLTVLAREVLITQAIDGHDVHPDD